MWTHLSVLFLLLVVACAPLNPLNTPAEDVGEIALRTIAFPLTLGTSEWIMAAERRMQAKSAARQVSYDRWYASLSPEQQVSLEAAQTQAAGQALIGLGLSGGIFQPAPVAPTYQPPHRASCWTTRSGPAIYTNCY